MRSHEFRRPLYVSLRVVTVWCLFWGIAGPMAHSQQSPAPPTPRTRPALPGTHVSPSPVPQKLGIVLHIDGPATVNKKMCSESTFDIKYSVINNTTELANGTIRARFNGAWLTPVGSAKLNNLPPGKAASGAFTACCSSSGSFTAWMEYRDKPSTAYNKIARDPYYAFDSLKISCTKTQ
jgi:hypothetical protein